MSVLTCLVNGVSYPVKIETSFTATDALETRGELEITLVDTTGAATFTRGQPLTLSDDVLGTLYTGYVLSDRRERYGPASTAVDHTLTCTDLTYRLDKRENTTNYLEWYAGDIAVDFVESTLANEGITVAAAQRHESTVADFTQGLLSGLASLSEIDDGDLEIAKAGVDLTFSETTTSDFATGTLTNMQATNNMLMPTTINALKMQSTLSFAYGVEFAQGQQTVSGSASGTGSMSASYQPAGFITIFGGNPGESASFNGSFATINSSGSLSLPLSASLSSTYQPKTRSKVKVKGNYYAVVTVDQAVADNRIDATIWTGSQVVGSGDTLNYDIWIASTSPAQQGGVDLVFSDGSTLTEYLGTLGTNTDTGIWDQNGVSVSPIQDLSDYARDCWYNRQIDLSIVSGKTVTAVTLFNAGNLAGVYDLYVKNCYLSSHSGSKFFSTTSTAPATNPPTISRIGAYVSAATLVSVVPVFQPAASSRVSPAYNIDPAKLVKSSLISWTASNPVIGPSVVADSPGAATDNGVEAIFVSYDGSTWLPCTNNQPLPGLPAGANCAGLSLYLLETFAGGQDPSAIPSLEQLSISIESAAHATTADITAAYGSTSAWNSGTKDGVAPNSNGDLALGQTSYSWSNTNNMDFVPGNSSSSNPTRSVTGGAYQVSSSGAASGTSWSATRFNFISAAKDFTAEADFTLTGTSPRQNEIGFVYRQTYWGSPNNSFAYYVRIMQAPGGQAGGTSITLGYGVNNPPSSGTGGGPSSGPFTVITQVSKTISSGTTYHVKLVVSQNRHTVYWNNSSTPSIDVLDNTYLQAGNIGIRTYLDSSNSATGKIANFTVTNTFAGLWTSPSISLNSLGTCGQTQIAWSEVSPTGTPQSTAIVTASLNGSTYTQCTNGATIPGLTVGTSTTGKSLSLQVILSASEFISQPILLGLYVRVAGAYPGSSGTRSTAPLGTDPMTRSDSTGTWGTAFDSQNYTKVGTGTTNLTSNRGLIANTTGDVHMVLGSRTDDDEESTVVVQLSASSMTAGMELRYTDANNYYRFTASATALTLFKRALSTPYTLATVPASLSTATDYNLRFRVTGSSSVQLFGKAWPVGTLEPTTWSITGTD